MKALGLLMMAVLSVCAGGCGSGSDAAAGGSLDSTQWKLTGWTISSLNPADFSITAKFSGGQISGHSGVNTYGGTYHLGTGGTFSTGPLACTEMAGPDAAMRAESAYFTLLAQVKTYTLTGSTLTLRDAGGNEVLIFDAGV